jgi:ketosteroid isomerase-like protein
MKLIFLTALTCWISYAAAGQSAQNEINDDVWKPFIATYNDRNTEGFLEIHSKDLVRSPRDAKKILTWDEYYAAQKDNDNLERKSGSRRVIELRFTERIASDRHAIEVGIYKVRVTDTAGNNRTFFGRFHVVLRKENNRWKILVDTDSTEEGTIDEQDFLHAQSME